MHREARSRGQEDDATARSTRSHPQAGELPLPPGACGGSAALPTP